MGALWAYGTFSGLGCRLRPRPARKVRTAPIVRKLYVHRNFHRHGNYYREAMISGGMSTLDEGTDAPPTRIIIIIN